jgi:uncharacterized membrane-anchored protein
MEKKASGQDQTDRRIKMKKQYIGLIIVVALVLGVTLSFVSYNQWPLLTGKRIVLATQPVDPFDPFMGQYLTINYEISRIPFISGFFAEDNIYVILEEDSLGVWRRAGFSREKPTSGVFIHGRVTRADGEQAFVEYGIEQYYFERNAELPTANITVEAKVTSSGRAKIVQLLHNGKPVEIKYQKFDIKS